MSFSKIFTTAALASLFAGILLTIVQQIGVIPSILEAEKYETSTPAPRANAAISVEPRDQGPREQGHGEGHGEGAEVGAPQDGMQRTLLTLAANVLIAMGFALLLGAASSLHGNILSWKSGLLWGLAGYVVFFVAPSLGLAPELPGTEAAALQTRKFWWVGTAVSTAGGLALIAFAPIWLLKGAGVILLLVPHLVGAPHPASPEALAPQQLLTTFIIATAIAKAIFWLSLGGAYGYFNRKLMGKT